MPRGRNVLVPYETMESFSGLAIRYGTKKVLPPGHRFVKKLILVRVFDTSSIIA
jgi:hypothetical protein